MARFKQPRAKIIVVLIFVLLVASAMFFVAKSQLNSADLKPSQTVDRTMSLRDGNVLHPCMGNPKDTCKSAPSIDFYPGGNEYAFNQAFEPGKGEQKEIMGKIIQINGPVVTLESSSGNLLKLIYPLDAVADFNTYRSVNYQNIKVEIGDTLYVNYEEIEGSDPLMISAEHISRSQLVLKDSNPKTDATIQKY